MPILGSPYKLTPERQKTIVEALAAGAHLCVVAKAAGISRKTLSEWMDKGRVQRAGHKRGVYRAFLEAVEQATAKAEQGLVAMVVRAGAVQWQAAAWMLERKHPGRWGRRERIEHTGKGGGPIETRDASQMTTDERKREIEQLRRELGLTAGPAQAAKTEGA